MSTLYSNGRHAVLDPFCGTGTTLFEFEKTDQGTAIACEKHYRLVPADELTHDELVAYSKRSL